MINYEWANSFAQRWCDAWNRQNIAEIMDFYAEDTRLNSPLVTQRWGNLDGWLYGKAKLRENFLIGLRNRNMKFYLLETLCGQGHICVLYARETGDIVCDTFSLDSQMLITCAVACKIENILVKKAFKNIVFDVESYKI